MQRAAAAERHGGEFLRVVPALGRHQPAGGAPGPGAERCVAGPSSSSPPRPPHAIEPPPAPIVVISTIGVRITRPNSIVVCAATAVLPLAINDTSNEVPPRSQVIRLSKPEALASAAPATTPAAGPDSAVRTGSLRAVCVDMMPPFDCTMWMRALLSLASAVSSLAM